MKIETVKGKGMVVAGNDVDTDRILPARFMKSIVFSGLEEHAFEDERKAFSRRGDLHPFDDPKNSDAVFLIAESNFGCGSSREHAVQSLARRGIKAIAAESFGEIFLGNCRTVGVTAFTMSAADLSEARKLAKAGESFTIDLIQSRVSAGSQTFAMQMDEGVRKQFTTGKWDTLAELLSTKDAAREKGMSLPNFGTEHGLF